MSFVLKSKDCWEWIGGKYYNGYGQFYESPNKIVAHRYSFKYYKGEIPDNMVVCHTCDNRSCVNPDHLFLGSQKDNIQDMMNKGRNKITSNHGEENGRSKITKEIVLEIRKRYKEESISAKKLGTEYGLGESQTFRIIKNISWKHIGDENET